jgi:hypothetical protein
VSIKIYKGFKFRTSNIFQVLTVINTFRVYAEREAMRIAEDFFEQTQQSFDPPLSKPEAWTKTHGIWRDLQKQAKNGIRVPMVDTEFKLVLFPHSEHNWLGMCFTEQEHWYEEFLKYELIEDFSYWNNTDYPDGMTTEEWENRWKVWKSVLGGDGNGIPAQHGFTIDVTHPDGPPVWDLARDKHTKVVLQ